MVDNLSPTRKRGMHTNLTRKRGLRSGFTLVELTVTLAVIAVVAVIVAQCTVWSLRERARFMAHQAALELAANVLEAGRAQPWEKLDQAWAEAQTVPTDMQGLLPDGRLIVKVVPEPNMPRTRRLAAEVRWQSPTTPSPQSVSLSTLLSARAASKIGGKP